MLKLEEIKKLIKIIDESSLDEFQYESEGTKLHLKKNNSPLKEVPKNAPVSQQNLLTENTVKKVVEKPAETSSGEDLVTIASPMVGTFYSSASPEDAPFVQVGSPVTEGTIVCIVEAMKLFNEITADISGEIVEVLVKNGQLVEYDQPLFKVKKNKE